MAFTPGVDNDWLHEACVAKLAESAGSRNGHF